MFFTTISKWKNFFFFQRARWKRHCATHWREHRGWDLVVFEYFVLSMRMQVIMASSFARLGSAPVWGAAGRKEGWYCVTSVAFCLHIWSNYQVMIEFDFWNAWLLCTFGKFHEKWANRRPCSRISRNELVISRITGVLSFTYHGK